MDCSTHSVKEMRALCRKHKIKGCSGLRKADLCKHLEKNLPEGAASSKSSSPTKITNEASFAQRDCSRKRNAWTKAQLLQFCKGVGLECSSRDTKGALCRKIAAHFRGEARETPAGFSTREEFQSKECGQPRQGWLRRELLDVCKALRIQKGCDALNKKQLCSLIADNFSQLDRRASSGRRERHRTRAAPGATLTSKSYMEHLPGDVARYAGKTMAIRDVLALCESNPTLAKHLCSTRFWRDYYTEEMEQLRRTRRLKDTDFAMLVAFKVHRDWLEKLGRKGTQKTVIAIQPTNSDDFMLVPLMVPVQKTQDRRRGRGSYGNQLASQIADELGEAAEVDYARDIPNAERGWETRGRKMFKKLAEIAEMI